MYKDNSTSSEFPKTLLIRNTVGGMIWQVYNVDNNTEVKFLSTNATRNGFEGISLEDLKEEAKETWPGWRDA